MNWVLKNKHAKTKLIEGETGAVIRHGPKKMYEAAGCKLANFRDKTAINNIE